MVMAAFQSRVGTFRLVAAFLVLWVCGPCGPLFDRFFAERFPDHGHLYVVGYHVHGFQVAYAGRLPPGHNLALGPDGAVMAELKATAPGALGPVQLLGSSVLFIPGERMLLRVPPEALGAPPGAALLLADPPPRSGPIAC